MKKIILLILLIAILIGSFFGTVYTNRHIFYNLFWTWLSNGFDYEYASDVGYGSEVAEWPDIYNKTYIIAQYESDKKLEYVKNGEKIILLNSVIAHEFRNDKFYVIAKDGYAVIDRNKTATICTSQEKVSLENVHYITCFEDFEKEDREVFESLGYPDKLLKLFLTLAAITCLYITALILLIIAIAKKR